ncbi:MAG TPA: aldo/keto reductase [Candidatus Acidoferrum sp.]|nr:aldo/keto reductase [Candidatus Acidoferrum sp.]
MTKQMDLDLGGSFTLPGTSMIVNRMGYGAMQLAGPGVWGPPRDVDGAIAVLREAVASGVNHIDTSDFYGPHVTNQIIKQALHPYPDGLVIVTKVGARRGEDKSWIHALSRQELIAGVHDNLRNLGLETLDVVNLRVGAVECFRQGCVVSGRGEFSASVHDEKRSATTSAISALGPGACYSGVSRVFSK